MNDRTAFTDRNLKVAGYCLVLEIACFAALSMILEGNGFSSYLAVVGLWLFNLVTAWRISKAANDFGKNKWFFGIMAAAGPPLAILAFSMLSLHKSMHRLHLSLSSPTGNPVPGNSMAITSWICAVFSGYLFGAILSASLAFFGVTHFDGDHRGEHIGFAAVFLGILGLSIGYAGYVGLSKRHVHPLKFVAAFLLGAAVAVATLTWLYTRHVT